LQGYSIALDRILGLPDGSLAVVSCWGRKPGKLSSPSSGTDVDVDERGVATGGAVWILDRSDRTNSPRLVAQRTPNGK